MPEISTAVVVTGHVAGPALVLDEPLSFWGGLDHETGRIIDAHHPQAGLSVSGRVLVMPGGRGSSSASSVLVEAVRAGTAPIAFVLGRPDEIIALGSLVAQELYGVVVPVVVSPPPPVSTGDMIIVDDSRLTFGPGRTSDA